MKRSIIFFCMSMLAAAASARAQAPAARVGDPTSHAGGQIAGPGVPTVWIGGMPAAVVNDLVICPLVEPPAVPHVGGPIVTGSATVLIGGRGAARMGDTVIETGPPSTIILGALSVLIGP